MKWDGNSFALEIESISLNSIQKYECKHCVDLAFAFSYWEVNSTNKEHIENSFFMNYS